MAALVLFSQITRRLSKLYPDLEVSRYLSAPSLEYKGRAFACCRDNRLTLKLRNENDLLLSGVKSVKSEGILFNHDRGKWLSVPYYFHLDWESLMQRAYSEAKEEYG